MDALFDHETWCGGYDDADPIATIDSFEPMTFETWSSDQTFVMTGYFVPCKTEVYFTSEQYSQRTVEEYTVRESERIEGVLPAGMDVGFYEVCASPHVQRAAPTNSPTSSPCAGPTTPWSTRASSV